MSVVTATARTLLVRWGTREQRADQTLHRSERAFESAAVLCVERRERPRECGESAIPSGEHHAAGGWRGLEPHCARVVGIRSLPRPTLAFEFLREPSDRWGADLFGGGERAEGAGSAEDEHRKGGEARRAYAGRGILPAEQPEKVQGAAVERLGDRVERAASRSGWSGGIGTDGGGPCGAARHLR